MDNISSLTIRVELLERMYQDILHRLTALEQAQQDTLRRLAGLEQAQQDMRQAQLDMRRRQTDLEAWRQAQEQAQPDSLRRLAAVENDVTSLLRLTATLRTRVDELQAQQSKASEVPGGDWYTAWRRETAPQHLEVDDVLIGILGETGECLRNPLVAELHRRGAINTDSPRSGAAQRPFQRLLDWEIIERVAAKREGGGGRPIEFFRLTERGQQAFRVLGDGEPVKSRYTQLLARHKSPEQVWLVLQAAEIMEPWADIVNLLPSEGHVRNLGFLSPDLEVVPPPPDGLLYVECERRAQGRDPAAMARKLEIFHRIGVGRLHVFVPSKAVQQAIIREVQRWSREREENTHLHICNVYTWRGQLRAGERRRDEAPWTLEKEYRYARLPWFESPSGAEPAKERL